MKYSVYIAAMIVGAFISTSVLAKKWTDITGRHSVEAEFVEEKDGKVFVKKGDGKVVGVPLEKLSEEDRQYVKSLNWTRNFPVFLNRLGEIVGSNPQWPPKGAFGVVEVLGQDKAPILLVPQVYPFGNLGHDKTTAALFGQTVTWMLIIEHVETDEKTGTVTINFKSPDKAELNRINKNFGDEFVDFSAILDEASKNSAASLKKGDTITIRASTGFNFPEGVYLGFGVGKKDAKVFPQVTLAKATIVTAITTQNVTDASNSANSEQSKARSKNEESRKLEKRFCDFVGLPNLPAKLDTGPTAPGLLAYSFKPKDGEDGFKQRTTKEILQACGKPDKELTEDHGVKTYFYGRISYTTEDGKTISRITCVY